jgi:hypothetical protein
MGRQFPELLLVIVLSGGLALGLALLQLLLS